MTETFTPEQITALGANIDTQLRELNTATGNAQYRSERNRHL